LPEVSGTVLLRAKKEEIMAATESNPEGAAAQEGLLTTAARTLGHAAGKAAKAIGLEEANSSVHAPGRSKTRATKTPKRHSARARRQDQATELKAKAASVLAKGSAELGAPYRRVMGKPATNWTVKDIDFVNGLITKHAAK
jgi:hypothetical protein